MIEITFHHDTHHAAYVNNLNLALAKHPELAGKSLKGLLMDLNAIPEEFSIAERNHGGGSWNHDLFRQLMAPEMGGEPQGELKKAIPSTFGTFDNFKTEFEKSGLDRFGSGWAWLVKMGNGLVIFSSTNQDTPRSNTLTPILGLDLWEHAYYLKYQNRRVEYIGNWWNVVNWAEVARWYSAENIFQFERSYPGI